MREKMLLNLMMAICFVTIISMYSVPVIADDTDEFMVDKGRYLATIMDCGGCHTDGYLIGQADKSRYFAGSSIGFGGPAGVVYPSNLTSHETHGLGGWSDEDIIRAIRAGVRPDGRPLAPIMPWPNYANLTDDDARALVAYLRSLEPNDFNPPDPVPAGERASSPYLELKVPEAVEDAE